MSTPKVSIVTPSFNQGRFMPETLRSVREQDYLNIEHIVVDGGSTDGTVDILRMAPDIRWVSEKDRGQVHALNKGFALATGEILGWLCSDDTLSPSAIGTAVKTLENTGADIVYGSAEIVDVNGTFIKMAKVVPFDFSLLLYCKNWIPQPTVFFRRKLLSLVGPLREEFDNAFDYELWLRMSEHGRLVFEPRIRSQMRVHPEAKSTARVSVTLQDYPKIRGEYWKRGRLPRFLLHKPWFWGIHYYYRAKRIWLWLQVRQQMRPPH